MDILLVRHAESIANTQGIYQGQTYDTDLSETGYKQATALAKALTALKIQTIYTSPLKRTVQTAEIINAKLLLNAPLTDNRLLEINHGKWEGKTKQQIDQLFPGQMDIWKNNPDNLTMPQGEHVNQVYQRILEFLQEISRQDYTRTLVVTHDAVIRVILTKLLMREIKDLWLYQLDAAGYSTIEWNGQFKQVIKINENSHLNGLASDLSQHAL